MKKLFILFTFLMLSLCGYAQVQYISSSTANSGGANTATVTIAYPASIQAGDMLVMATTNRDASVFPTTPTGWLFLGGGSNPPISNGTLLTYTKVATGTESGTFNYTYPSATTQLKMVSIYVFRNASWVNPKSQGGNATTASYTGNATSRATGSMVVDILFSPSFTTIATYTGGNVTWSEPVQESSSNLGGGTTLGINAATPADGFTVAGGSQALANNNVFSLLLPAKEVPHSIPGMHAWWKYNTDINVISGGVSSWFDQSGRFVPTMYQSYSMNQATAANRPTYSGGGMIGDGVNDFLESASAINETNGEVTAVIELPTGYNGGKAIFSKNTYVTADGNALSFYINGSLQLHKNINNGTGSPVVSNQQLSLNQKVIVSFSRGTTGKLWINGVECTYSLGNTGGWLGSGNNTLMRLFREARITSGGQTNLKIYDVTYYNHELTTTERANLTAYQKGKHGIP